jgi:tetratricopeptide (TPR) repeat protein
LGGLELHSDFEKLSLPDQVRLVRAAWAKPTPRLLVFDNCEDLALLTRWRPSSGGCRVLVTSRQGRWEAALGVQALALDVLYREESVDLLRKHRPNLTRDQANAIAAELGDLPLALHLAGSYLETYRDDPLLGDPVDFLAELRDAGLLDHPALRGVDVDFSPTAHALHVGRTFALSYERLDARDPTDALALALLGRAAYFAPGEAIPRDLLLTTLDLEGGDRDEARRAARGLRRLVGLGLLAQEEGGALTLHRLLAAFGQGLADEGAQQAVEKILYNEANRLNKVGYPALLLAWQPHLRAVTDAAMGREDERAARLCSALDFHLSMIGDYIGARPYSERALAIREKVLGAEHPRTASSLNNLGALLDSMGDLAGAQPYYERALAINEKVLGAEHPDTARSLNNLGTLLYSMGDLTGARSYFERVLAICEAVLGAEHPDTARSLNNLGALLYSMGDLTGARSYFERVLAIFEAALGAEHPDTAQSLNNLGYLLRAMGNLAEAQPYYERALTIREAVLGAEHPDTALSLNNMGALLVAMGDLAEARPYYERALTIREKALGAEHPDTALSLNNMGALLRATGDYESARPYFERALAICTARLGPDHPHTRMVQGNLADLDARSSQTLKVFLNL